MVDKISEDVFPHKQMSEHAKIRNTDNTRFMWKTRSGKNHEGARVSAQCN